MKLGRVGLVSEKQSWKMGSERIGAGEDGENARQRVRAMELRL